MAERQGQGSNFEAALRFESRRAIFSWTAQEMNVRRALSPGGLIDSGKFEILCDLRFEHEHFENLNYGV